jgi:hypothetical protein
VALDQCGGDPVAVRDGLSDRFAAPGALGRAFGALSVRLDPFHSFHQRADPGHRHRLPFLLELCRQSFLARDHPAAVLLALLLARGLLETRSYALAEHSPRRYIGHNPLAVLSMHVLFVWVAVFMVVTGVALYGEGEGPGWIHTVFTGPVLWLFGNSFTVHTWHHFGMWAMVIFVLVHIYAAVRRIFSRARRSSPR